MVVRAPWHIPVVASGNIEAYLSSSDGRLSTQREEARELLFKGFRLYEESEATGYTHPEITLGSLEQNLRCFDYTILADPDHLDDNVMRRFADRSLGPVPLRSVCTWDEERLLKPVLEFYEEAGIEQGDAKLAAVSDFPHGWSNADKKAQNIARIRSLDPEAKYLADIDNVADIAAWMSGDKDRVRQSFAAEAQACVDHGFYMKCIISASIHAHSQHNQAYGSDYFASIYDITTMALEEMHKHGLDGAVKSSTGLGAQPPFHQLVSKDDGAMIVKALPRWMAIRDFNAQNGTSYTCKESGGENDPMHGFVSRALISEILGADASDKMMIGGGPDFRDRTLMLMHKMGDNRINPRRDYGPYKLQHGDVSLLPPHLTGMPRVGECEDPVLPPELRVQNDSDSSLNLD